MTFGMELASREHRRMNIGGTGVNCEDVAVLEKSW